MLRRLLVVDDERELVRLLVELARDYGYAASGTSDAADVLPRIRQDRTDVVLLDLRLPRAAGPCLLEQIRTEPDPPIVIVMTGWCDLPLQEACRKHGAADIVRKPFDVDDLFRRIEVATASTPARRR